MLTDATVRQFLDEAASGAPTPGGGSVAAVSGALGAALLSMVCNLTIGREKYRDVEPEMQALLAETEALRHQLTDLVQADIDAFGSLSAAMKLPRGSDEEKKVRTAAMQAALVKATTAPLAIARCCARVVELSRDVAAKGNVNAISDAGVGVLLGEAAMRSALLNVQINLGLIKDREFVDRTVAEVAALTAGKSEEKEAVVDLVNRHIAGS